MNMKEKLAKALRDKEAAAASAGAEEAKPIDPDGAETLPVPKDVIDVGTLVGKAAPASNIAEDAVKAAGTPESQGMFFKVEKVEVSAEDKSAFMDALFEGGRFTRSFSLYGGKISGEFRSRTAAEDMAIWTWARHKLIIGEYAFDAEFRADLRYALLAASVASVNGTVYPELAQPLMRQAGEKGVTPQGWLWQVSGWAAKPTYVTEALYPELAKFESVYWALVAKATSSDF